MKSLLALAFGIALVGTTVGCRRTPAQGPAAQMDQNPGDPADVNMAPVNDDDSSAQPAQYQPQQGEEYTQLQGAPIERRAPESGPGDPNYSAQGDPGYDNGQYDTQQAEDAYAADLTDAEANDPPPPLPDYEQPPAPDPDYLWTPGYWGWGDGGYYWVPGCWVAAPYEGALWTPGYWGFFAGHYRFHHGFWGLHIGFYGGVDYGYGYIGHGYYGGYWDRGHFRYNTAVNRVNMNVIRNVYVHNVVVNNVVVNNRIVNHVSYSGGRGGLNARPLPAEMAVLHEERRAPMASQVRVQHEAAQNRAQFFTQNHGRPAAVVNARPVIADRTPTAVLPRVAVAMGRPARPGNPVRPGNQMQGGIHGVQPQSQFRPGLPQTQERNAQPIKAPGAGSQPPRNSPGQPQSQFRPGLPQQQRGLQPENRPVQPQPEGRQDRPQLRQDQPRSEGRPTAPVQPGPQQPAAPQPRPQHLDGAPRPQPEVHAAPPPHPPDQQPHRGDRDHH
jgi:hypothetical protein